MRLSNKLEIIMIDAIINYIQDTIEITPELINKLNKNIYIDDGDNTNYFKEYNIEDFIEEQFVINWQVNNLKFGNYVLKNNVFDKDDADYKGHMEELYENSTHYRCGDEEEQEEQYNDLVFIISRIGYNYLQNNDTDFILDFLNSYYDTPILK
jgi:hypothetical protein